MNLGQSIKVLRGEMSPPLRQQELARRSGITQTYLSQIEGGTKSPSVEVMEKISQSIGIPLGVIFWMGIEECDVAERKKEAFRVLKPIVDNLIKSLI